MAKEGKTDFRFVERVSEYTKKFIDRRVGELGLKNKKEYFDRLLIKDGLYEDEA
jgi:hypothetical protein